MARFVLHTKLKGYCYNARWYILNVYKNEYEKVDLDIFIKHIEDWENIGFHIESVENDVCLFKYAYFGKVKTLIAFSVAW